MFSAVVSLLRPVNSEALSGKVAINIIKRLLLVIAMCLRLRQQQRREFLPLYQVGAVGKKISPAHLGAPSGAPRLILEPRLAVLARPYPSLSQRGRSPF